MKNRFVRLPKRSTYLKGINFRENQFLRENFQTTLKTFAQTNLNLTNFVRKRIDIFSRMRLKLS